MYKWLRERMDNPCVVLPTGAGKSPVLAAICRDAVTLWDGRVLVLAHVKELLQQNAGKIRLLCPTVPVGVYSAGLGRRDAKTPVVVAGVQSVHDKAGELGRFDLVIVDESHLIPAAGQGMYRRLIGDLREANPDLRVIGLTATPFRTGSGEICGPDAILNGVCYEAGVKELIVKGYLSPLVNKAGVASVDVSGLRVQAGEYRDDEAEREFTADGVVDSAVAEVLRYTEGRKSTLLFCQTVGHAREVADAIRVALGGKPRGAMAVGPADPDSFDLPADDSPRADAGPELVGEIYGDTPTAERARLIAAFRAGVLKRLVNVNVLTTGFDAPNVDCVCLLRATASPGLYYQMVGRGFRLAEGKENCLILDFGTNIVRHGPVDKVKPRKGGPKRDDGPAGKECPECHEVVPVGASACPSCGHVWPKESAPAHDATASDEDPVSGKPKLVTRQVQAVTYSVHTKKGADEDAPKTVRVTYQTGLSEFISEWVCVEHHGFAESKARRWWSKRCRFPMPRSAVEAAAVADHGLLSAVHAITVKVTPGERFPEIVAADLGTPPAGPDPCPDCDAANLRVIVESDAPRFPGRVVCGTCSHFYGYAGPEMVSRWGLLSDPGRQYWGGMLDFYDLESTHGDPTVSDADESLAPAHALPDEADIPF